MLVVTAANAAEEKVLNVYNWSDYIAEDTIANFEKKTGIGSTYLKNVVMFGSTGIVTQVCDALGRLHCNARVIVPDHEEADRLASRLAVIDRGRVISEGTADDLKDQMGGDVLEVVVADRATVGPATEILGRYGPDPSPDEITGKVAVTVGTDTSAVMGALRALEDEGVDVADLQLRRPTLDDVFLTLTGRSAEDAEAEAEPVAGGRRRPRR